MRRRRDAAAAAGDGRDAGDGWKRRCDARATREGRSRSRSPRTATATERACHLDLDPDGDPSRLAGADAPRRPDRRVVRETASRAGARRLWGSPVVTDELSVAGLPAPIRLTRHARAFFQGNRFLLADLVHRVVQAVPEGRVLDLYAGVGLFSVAVAACGGRDVTAVEGDAVSAEDLKHNAARYGARDRRASPAGGGLSLRAATRVPAFATVIVDPPRTGMTKDAAERHARAWAVTRGVRVVRRRDARARHADATRYAAIVWTAWTRSTCSRTRLTWKRSPSLAAIEGPAFRLALAGWPWQPIVDIVKYSCTESPYATTMQITRTPSSRLTEELRETVHLRDHLCRSHADRDVPGRALE